MSSARVFDSGATRDSADGKLDFEAFFSPLVLVARAEYMRRNSVLPDGSARDGDNWQLGMPVDVALKSLLRHVVELWRSHRDGEGLPVDELCAAMFNLECLLFERLSQ